MAGRPFILSFCAPLPLRFITCVFNGSGGGKGSLLTTTGGPAPPFPTASTRLSTAAVCRHPAGTVCRRSAIYVYFPHPPRLVCHMRIVRRRAFFFCFLFNLCFPLLFKCDSHTWLTDFFFFKTSSPNHTNRVCVSDKTGTACQMK